MILQNNKIIWIYWNKGWENAPLISKLCLQSWINYNPEYLIVPLDDNNINKYIDLKNLQLKYLSDIDIVSLSDIIRIMLLNQYGGIWVDSTVLCLRNITNLLMDYYNHLFFAYAGHTPYLNISSWFIYSEPESIIIQKWMSSIINYWHDRKNKDQYFWLHYLFQNLCHTNKNIATIWQNIPQKTALEKDLNGPHAFVPYMERLNGLLTDNELLKNYIDKGYNNNYCLKLSRHWNTDYYLLQNNTIINYLFRKENLI